LYCGIVHDFLNLLEKLRGILIRQGSHVEERLREN
jgi:hypothetical protein